MAAKKKETPLMQQYYSIKNKYPDAVLLFRVGDFYETFGEDAEKASEILGIVLTKRKNGAASSVALAGFPHHSLETYLPKLVRAGLRVAICDQLEDPKATKGIVKRGVTELVTPGVAINDQVLDHKKNNYLAAVHWDKKIAGVAFLDISTGEFFTSEGSEPHIKKLIATFQPSEILFEADRKNNPFRMELDRFCTFGMEDWVFTEQFALDTLLNHFGTKSLKGFGVDKLSAGLVASGAALHYLSETRHTQLKHVAKIQRIDTDDHVWLDSFTLRNLELIYSPHAHGTTLFDILHKTRTPMGSRLLKRWIAMPLKSKSAIDKRLDCVSTLLEQTSYSAELDKILQRIGDLERLASKVAMGRISPREVVQLGHGLESYLSLIQLLESGDDTICQLAEKGQNVQPLQEKIAAEIHEEAPTQVNKGNVFKAGVSTELDDLRDLLANGKQHLVDIQKREMERTGISSLKIGFNNVFGYYLEVTNAHKDKVPEEWTRKQTLVNAERYITQELKEYETKILGAEEKIEGIESQLYQAFVLWMADYLDALQINANLVANIDCLLSFAKTAKALNYVRPEVVEEQGIIIEDGRHPVIEQMLKREEVYVANSLTLNPDEQQIMVITGPNMSGKSALLRQTALITIMAQMGCFVPAKSAKIGCVDRIFTRVGANDNLSQGESTFMVEMNETASILNNLSNGSLVLLDEIGRGTSTYDGISIAWAIAEYLHEHPARPLTMFATHYHELNEMADQFPRIKNFNVSVKEHGKQVIFLRKLSPGGSAHSFGIHVAKMAGVPQAVVKRSEKLLAQLEKDKDQVVQLPKATKAESDDLQLSFFQLDDPVLLQVRDAILDADIDNLTPVEALMKLNEIKSVIGQ